MKKFEEKLSAFYKLSFILFIILKGINLVTDVMFFNILEIVFLIMTAFLISVEGAIGLTKGRLSLYNCIYVLVFPIILVMFLFWAV